MNFLLDTHTFIWVIFEPEKLSGKTKSLLLDRESVPYISLISFWEISLKFSLGKMDLQGILPDELPKVAKKDGFEILDLTTDIVASFYKLPKMENKDPFDRMIIWQAIQKDLSLISKDTTFKIYEQYGLKLVW